MLKNVVDFSHPETAREALRIINEDDKSRFIAGGTGLALSQSQRPVHLVDITRLDLSGIEIGKEEITIGATTTLSEIIESRSLPPHFSSYLGRSLNRVATYPLRNAATIGGSFGRAFPWSDVIPIFWIWDARVVMYAGETEVSKPVSQFYSEKNFHSQLSECLIREIRIPRGSGVSGAKFFKFGRSSVDIPSLNFAIRLEVGEDGKIEKAWIVVGARPGLARSIATAEEFLTGRDIRDEIAVEASQLASREVNVADDKKLTAEYRRSLVETFTERGLVKILNDIVADDRFN